MKSRTLLTLTRNLVDLSKSVHKNHNIEWDIKTHSFIVKKFFDNLYGNEFWSVRLVGDARPGRYIDPPIFCM